MQRREAIRGCLLGIAAGDALGYAVDRKNYTEIVRDYGPDGLRGYDTANGCADVSSYTQVAAYAANGLLLGSTRGRMRGVMAPYVRYIELALKEWAATQRFGGAVIPRPICWLTGQKSLRFRRPMDLPMSDSLTAGKVGSMEEPCNRSQGPGAVTAAIPVALFLDPAETPREEIVRMGAQTVALTHGNPNAFLAGAMLCHIISRIVWDNITDLQMLTGEVSEMLLSQFSPQYPQAAEIARLLKLALGAARAGNLPAHQAMDQFDCTNGTRAVVGALYCCLLYPDSLDDALSAAVNHSGRSCACGAIVGAIFGAMCGESCLEDFYLGELQVVEPLRELADDLEHGCPMDADSRLYDADWAGKYLHGGN